MAVIKKKTWPEWFEKVLAGDKTYDLRLNDFEIDDGDTLVLEEWDPATKEYTGRSIEKQVGFVGKFKMKDLEMWWSKEELEDRGIQVISFK